MTATFYPKFALNWFFKSKSLNLYGLDGYIAPSITGATAKRFFGGLLINFNKRVASVPFKMDKGNRSCPY
jgi:hypothetical protein